MSVDADRIAQLTAELAEARSERDQWNTAHERACSAHERTKVELAEARRDLHEERGRSRDYLAALERERVAYERTKAERDQWEHEAKSNATKLVGEMKQRAMIAELRYCIERLNADVKREREGFTRRRRDKDAQWRELVASRDAAIAREQAAQAEAAAIQLAVLARIEQGAEEWRTANDARGSSINDYYHVAMRALFLRFPAGSALAERVRQLEVVAAKARVAVGKTYRAGADDDLRDALAALDAEGGA